MESIVALLAALERSPPAVSIAESAWAFPVIETIHVIGLTLTIGTVLVLDLRLLGLASLNQRFTALRRSILPWTWLAFGGAAVSGFLMFSSQAVAYFQNDAFRIKLVLLLLAGLNMLVFELMLARGAGGWGDKVPVPWPGRIAALLSLALWISIVFLGRRVGFTMLLGQN